MTDQAIGPTTSHRAIPGRTPPPVPTGPAFLRPLTPVPRTLDVVLAFGGAVLGGLWGWTIGSAPGYLLDWDGFQVTGTLLAGSGACYVLWGVLGRGAGWTLADVGFRRSRSRHLHLLWQVPLLLTLVLALATILLPLGGETRDSAGAWDASEATALALAVVVVLPLVVEVLLRRLLLDRLGARGSGWMVGSGLVVAMATALLYVLPAAVLYFGVLGCCLVLLRWWHGTLWAPLALHVSHNLLIVLGVAWETLR